MQDLSDLGSQANMELVDLLAKRIGLLVVELERKTLALNEAYTLIEDLQSALAGFIVEVNDNNG